MNIIFVTIQGHVTPKWLIRSGCNSNVWDIMPALVTCKFDEDWFDFWFDFCFTALQHILGHFGCSQLP